MSAAKKIEKCYGIDCLRCVKRCRLYACGVDVIREKQDVLAISNGKTHCVYIDAMADGVDSEDFLPEELKSLIVDEDNPKGEDVDYSIASEALRRLYWMLKERPDTAMALLDSTFAGDRQADIARARGVTRQAVSKKLKGDISAIAELLGMRVPVAAADAKLLELNPREFAVYRLLMVDGCTVRSAAIQLGISKTTVHRMGQVLRRKLNKNGTRKDRKK